MNKRISIIVIVILSILLILSGSYTIIHYFHNYSSEEWFQEKCDNGYTVIGKRIGEPSWGGTSKALIEIYDTDTNTIILQFETGIHTNGNSLSDKNYNISINDDYIALRFYNENKSISGVYRFYYEDLREMIRE